MMRLFRKHQKKFFIVIFAVTVLSFALVGTVNVLHETPNLDKKIGHTFNGKPITDRQLQVLIKFLSLGSHEVLKEDLMAKGLIPMLGEKYFNQFKDEFHEKLQKAKQSKPYVHPKAPFLSAMQIWSRFIPELVFHLQEVQMGDVSPKTFVAYSQLYLDQVAFPPELLGRILCYQQQQCQGLPPDRHIYDSQYLALFGHHSFEEWFGPKYAEILGKFIFNAAQIAEEKGYKVSLAEARAYLLQTYLRALKTASPEQEFTFSDASQCLRTHLHHLIIDESQAAKICQKILLAQRLFNDIGQGIFIDPISYQKFMDFSEQKVVIDAYTLPIALQIKNFNQLIQLCYYHEAVSPNSHSFFEDLPHTVLSAKEIEKMHPELVVEHYELGIAKISKEEVSQHLSLKETWDYQLSDEGWSYLKTQYSFLKDDQEPTKRSLILEELDPEQRLIIDKMTRLYLVSQRPEFIEEQLRNLPMQKHKVALLAKGKTTFFEDIKKISALSEALQSASIGSDGFIFSEDQDIFYHIVVWDKSPHKEILTFQEALNRGCLLDSLEKKLQDFYEQLCQKQDPEFQDASGSFKKFIDVRDTVAKRLYEHDLNGAIIQENMSQEELDRYFIPILERAQSHIQKYQEESYFLKPAHHPLLDQWKLSKQTQEIKRSDITKLSKSDLFSMPIKAWSSLVFPKNRETVFYCLIEKSYPKADIQKQVEQGQKLLGMDAQRLLMHQVLERMESNHEVD